MLSREIYRDACEAKACEAKDHKLEYHKEGKNVHAFIDVSNRFTIILRADVCKISTGGGKINIFENPPKKSCRLP